MAPDPKGHVGSTATGVNRTVTGHDLAAVGRLAREIATTGMMRFGKPMLYAVLITALVQPAALLEPEMSQEDVT